MGDVRHFSIRSNAASPAPEEITAHLERTWSRFRDVFGIEPATVEVVLSVVEGGPHPTSSADGGPRGAERAIAWTVKKGEGLDSQGFSDLSHEIAHIYLLDVMGNPQGLHQPHAWLHEAVACHHETPPFRKNRLDWIRERLGERFPLEQLFAMKNPVKENPLVELTTSLHEKLAKGEITVAELNEKVSAYAGSHTQELMDAGTRNMTYYAQSLSVFEFLLEREGRPFVRAMVQKLTDGVEMQEILRELDHYPEGISSVEEAWVRWVEAGAGAEAGGGATG